MSHKIPSVLLVGCGPHAKRVYLPALKELEEVNQLKLSCVLEVADNIAATIETVRAHGLSSNVISIQKSEDGSLSSEIKIFLDELHKRYNFDGIVISSEPTQHKQYILWALKNKLHILADKPLTTYNNISNNSKFAYKLYEDFLEFKKNYIDGSKAFIINAQRRYHKGFLLVQQKIHDIAIRFQVPVTSISAMHSDGQWRFPDEIITQDYHGYNTGYGKVSHSGYHIIDMVAQYIKAGSVTDKMADEYEYYTKFIRPDGLIKQLSLQDYTKIFSLQQNELLEKFKNTDITNFAKYGEVDSHTSIVAKKHGVNIAHYSIDLMHNTFSRRNWIKPGEDLYKGNGRVKHECHNITQGPFQTIQIHSYQSSDKHETNTVHDYNIGGNNHFDIYIFRNNILTGDKAPFEKISINELSDYNPTKLVTELTKKTVVYEFSDIMNGIKKPTDSLSHFLSHSESIQMMSNIYVSAQEGNKVVSSYKYES